MAKPKKEKGKWRIRWWDADGKRRSQCFSSYADAQRALAHHQVEAEEVKAGIRPAPQPDRTFSDLADYWLEHRTSRKKNPKDDHSLVRAHLRPFFGELPIHKITLERIDAYRRLKCPREHDTTTTPKQRRAAGTIGPKTLHNHLTLLISMLNLAVDLGWIRSRPKVRKPRLTNDDYRYLRTQDDIVQFLLAAQDEDPGVFEMYATAVYTGMRAGEVCGLRWQDIDMERRLITVQHSYESTTKTSEIRHVPILDVLLPILRSWKLRCPHSRVVFVNQHGTAHGPSARVLQEIFRRVRERAEIPYYFTFHSLRHTFASHWMMRGGDIYRLQRVLGHKTIQMTERYSHLAPDAFTETYVILGEAAPGLTEDHPGKVVDLKSK